MQGNLSTPAPCLSVLSTPALEVRQQTLPVRAQAIGEAVLGPLGLHLDGVPALLLWCQRVCLPVVDLPGANHCPLRADAQFIAPVKGMTLGSGRLSRWHRKLLTGMRREMLLWCVSAGGEREK